MDYDEITKLLGVSPSRIERKGEPRTPSSTKINKRGCWVYSLEFKKPGELNNQIAEIFEKTTKDDAAWLFLTQKYEAFLWIGIFIEEINEEIGLSAHTIKTIAERCLKIDFDIYYSGNAPTS